MNTQSEEARARLTEVADNAGSFDRCAVVVSFDDALRLLLAFHPIDKDAGTGREAVLAKAWKAAGDRVMDPEALARWRQHPWGHAIAACNGTSLGRLVGLIDYLADRLALLPAAQPSREGARATIRTETPASPANLLAHLKRIPMTEWVWADAQMIFATLEAATPSTDTPSREGEALSQFDTVGACISIVAQHVHDEENTSDQAAENRLIEKIVARLRRHQDSAPATPSTGTPDNAEVREALAGIADDYMTSETHHPGYVLIPAAKFEQLRRLSTASTQGGE